MVRIWLLVFLVFFCFVSVNSQVRQEAYDFSFTDLDGKPRNLSDFENKVVLLLIWSTACPICRAEINRLNELVEKYEGEEIVFLALTIEKAEKVRNFLKKNPFLFKVVLGDFVAISKYSEMDSEGRFFLIYPSYFLIDKRRRVVSREKGSDKVELLAKSIEALLREK